METVTAHLPSKGMDKTCYVTEIFPSNEMECVPDSVHLLEESVKVTVNLLVKSNTTLESETGFEEETASVCDVPQNRHPDYLRPTSHLHPALWARWDPSTSSFRYVWIETMLSRAVADAQQWHFEKLPQNLQFCRSMQDWFNMFLEILQEPLVQELLELFTAGYLPATVAAELGEKERAAAFAEPHPLAWIDFDTPRIVPSDRQETVFGYSCATDCSYMLRVVGRGFMDQESTWYAGSCDFIQHGQLALLKQAFAVRVRLGVSIGVWGNWC
jgi:hypothetical protein